MKCWGVAIKTKIGGYMKTSRIKRLIFSLVVSLVIVFGTYTTMNASTGICQDVPGCSWTYSPVFNCCIYWGHDYCDYYTTS